MIYWFAGCCPPTTDKALPVFCVISRPNSRASFPLSAFGIEPPRFYIFDSSRFSDILTTDPFLVVRQDLVAKF